MKTFTQIREWAEARNLIAGSDSFRQLAKLAEETGELAADISRGRPRRRIADSIGDCVVVLTILAAQNGLQIEDCITQAYDEIKERKGVMKDGVFVCCHFLTSFSVNFNAFKIISTTKSIASICAISDW